MTGPGHSRVVRVREHMGTVMSVHVLLSAPLPEAVEAGIEDGFALLAEADARFSPFRADSEVSRIRRGELRLEDAHPDVAEVAAACRVAETVTGGRFSAWREGWFDPTGIVKGWAAQRAAALLRPLFDLPGVEAIGLNAGGDLQLATAADSDWTWRIGIADPADRAGVLATVELRDGAVATSGTAERGAHILDPRTGMPAAGVRAATIVADELASADVWATAAVVAGFDDLGWINSPGIRSGLLVADDGRIRRFANGVELVAADAGTRRIA